MNVVLGPATTAVTSSPPAAGAIDESALSAERPFPGLRPFFFADRDYFFGRESQIYALYRLVEHGRFIAVIGSSGSGKSSLVLAGLCRLLAEESADPGGPHWVYLDMRPGASPLSRLAKALARLSPGDNADESARRRDRIEYRLRQSGFSLQDALAEAGGSGGGSLILVVDQFEELFRFGLAGLGQRRAGVEEARQRDEAAQFVQILLDADRRRIENVRVLITMRSDFIGDCAYFHGLSEAVSATQYLVPNLTRGQLEEAIRKPIEKAAGTIEPELVERIINDCGDELDQLPVMQHCLMRLWDRAGAAAAEQGARRLTRQTYEDIGRMAEALSRHADEILAQCAGKELAVEQTFRALSELDREGRAIRRALRFDKLLAETGVKESDLRAVLDRFRDPTCSFLLPSPSVSPMLAADDRIDIGHETLLRRWKKLAGETETVEARRGGWLGREQVDGQRYRTLVSLLEGDAGGEKATLTDPARTKAWWESLPRTAAWADRYGGNFDNVRTLIDDNIAAKLRSGRIRRRSAFLTAALVCAGVLGAGAWFVNEQSLRLQQGAIDKGAMKSAKTLLERVLQAYTNRSLDLAGARSLATVSEQFLNDIRASNKTSAADSLWAESLDVEADLQMGSGNNAEALALASKAREAAMPLTQSNPTAQEPLQVLYDATVRTGNALMGLGRFQEALAQYKEAVAIAGRIVSLGDADAGEFDLIDAHMKLGVMHHVRRDYANALSEYRVGLLACESALGKFPQSLELLRSQNKAYYMIAESLRTQKSFDEARIFYQKTLEGQTTLLGQHSSDLSLKSNLAATYAHWALLEKEAGNLELALSQLQRGVALQEEVVKSRPGDPQWEDYVAPNYIMAAEILEQLGRPKDALVAYQKFYDTRMDLAGRTPANAPSQVMFVEAAKMLGDRSAGFARIEAYHAALRTWKRLIENANSANLVVDKFEGVLGLAQAFEAAQDWPDAQTAYAVAEKIARLNLAKDPSDTSPWRDKADAAARASVEAERAAETAPVDAPH